MQLFDLKFNKETGIPTVHKCPSIDRNLHIRLSYHGLVVLLPELFRYKHNCTLTKFKDTLKAFDNFKNKQKSVWSNVFWYVKVCIFWKCIQYTIHWDKTQMLKKIPSDKINGTKNALCFLLRAPTHHSFTFNFRFFYKVISLELYVGFSIFDSVSLLYFYSIKCMDYLTFKTS